MNKPKIERKHNIIVHSLTMRLFLSASALVLRRVRCAQPLQRVNRHLAAERSPRSYALLLVELCTDAEGPPLAMRRQHPLQ